MRKELEARIQEQAYFIWLEEGQPQGKESDHWLLAEARVMAQLAEDSQPDAAPPPPAGAILTDVAAPADVAAKAKPAAKAKAAPAKKTGTKATASKTTAKSTVKTATAKSPAKKTSTRKPAAKKPTPTAS